MFNCGEAAIVSTNATEQAGIMAGWKLPNNDSNAGPDRAVKQILWWLCLFVAPAVLVAIELFHPSGFTAQPGMYAFLS
ncbi:MAG: hypothetical protein AAB403_01645, partial [Planctomycetota bacterium]